MKIIRKRFNEQEQLIDYNVEYWLHSAIEMRIKSHLLVSNVNQTLIFIDNEVIEQSGKQKWIRIAIKCWKTRTPYNESMYLEALKRRDSPLLKFAVNT